MVRITKGRATKGLVAAGLALRRNQYQPWTLACYFRLRGAAEGVQNTDHCGIGRTNAQSNRGNYREAENNGDEERNHVFTNLISTIWDAAGVTFD